MLACIGEDLLIGRLGNENNFISLHHVSIEALLLLCGRHEENDLISYRLFKRFEKSHRDASITASSAFLTGRQAVLMSLSPHLTYFPLSYNFIINFHTYQHQSLVEKCSNLFFC
jgi:hypothetical protein